MEVNDFVTKNKNTVVLGLKNKEVLEVIIPEGIE